MPGAVVEALPVVMGMVGGRHACNRSLSRDPLPPAMTLIPPPIAAWELVEEMRTLQQEKSGQIGRAEQVRERCACQSSNWGRSEMVR